MAIFMVMMVLMVISAMGIFAARAASQVDMAVGQSRHAMQAQYTAEFGLQAMTAYIAQHPTNVRDMLSGKTPGYLGTCVIQNTPTCVRLEWGDIYSDLPTHDQVNGFLGSLNHDSSPNVASGTFSVELDDFAGVPANIPGTKGMELYEVTMLSVGKVAPAGAINNCTAAFAEAESTQKISGHILFGPIPSDKAGAE
jgi:hypothetical protein